jgi:hypothetical protein
MHGALLEKQIDWLPALESGRATIGEAKQKEMTNHPTITRSQHLIH